MSNDRHKKGLEMMDRLDPDATQRLVNGMKDICPDMAQYVIDFAYGEIIARPGLDLRTREISTISALTALGNAPLELRWHIRKAFHIGVMKEELAELMLHLVVYAGFPAAINGVHAIQDVLRELQEEAKHKK